MRYLQWCLFLLTLPALLLAGDSSAPALLRGPVLGYVLDGRSGSIRPLNGIPGSSHLGRPLALPFPVSRAVFSSQADFALLVSGREDGAVFLASDLGGPSPVLMPVAGAIEGPDRIVMNSVESAAALYSAYTRRVQIVRGLPERPVADPALELASLSGKVTALAIDNRATGVLIAGSEDDRGALYWVEAGPAGLAPGPSPGLRFLANFARPSALALLRDDQDVAVTDAGRNELLLVRNFAGAAEVFLLAGERDGISNPVAVAAWADGRLILAANAEDAPSRGSLAIIDLSGVTPPARLALEAVPSRLDRLRGRSSFLLTEPGQAPLLLFDATDSSSLYFVPASKEE